MGRTRFFILDSSRPCSLTLRDYSKVVAADKLSLSRKNKLSRDVWRFHAVTASPLLEGLPCRCDFSFPSNSTGRSGYGGARPWARLRSERSHLSRREGHAGQRGD